jgi:integrase/recombinase XerD
MLTNLVESYVEMKRACGFPFGIQSNLLRRFAELSDVEGDQFLRADTAIKWARKAPSVYQSARRLGHVIRLARYLRTEDPCHESPAPVFGSHHRPRRVPYTFSSEEIQRLLYAASQSGYRTLRRDTYTTLFALLACTGLRVSEARNLRDSDITQDGLVIRCSKFRRSRMVPLHETAHAALERYIENVAPMLLSTITCLFHCEESRCALETSTVHSIGSSPKSACPAVPGCRNRHRTHSGTHLASGLWRASRSTHR